MLTHATSVAGAAQRPLSGGSRVHQAHELNAVVRVDALQHFVEFVSSLGGNLEEIFGRTSVSVEALSNANALIPYRGMIIALERAAATLDCPSFGLQLATLQGGMQVLGPLEVAMRNSQTLGDAYQYCAEHLQAYSPVVQIRIECEKGSTRRYIRFEILLDRAPHQQQAVEHAVALMHHAIISLSNGAACLREVWFTHEPVSPLPIYRRYFGTRVCFGQPMNAVFLNATDFELPLTNRSEQLYHLATSFIDNQYPSASSVLSAQVRVITTRLLAVGQCTHVDVAEALGMHPRTMQRHLRGEGLSFEQIKDDVRRDVVLRYLGQRSVSLTRIATMVGYSEASVLTRSCYRWFRKSPRKVRAELRGAPQM